MTNTTDRNLVLDTASKLKSTGDLKKRRVMLFGAGCSGKTTFLENVNSIWRSLNVDYGPIETTGEYVNAAISHLALAVNKEGSKKSQRDLEQYYIDTNAKRKGSTTGVVVQDRSLVDTCIYSLESDGGYEDVNLWFERRMEAVLSDLKDVHTIIFFNVHYLDKGNNSNRESDPYWNNSTRKRAVEVWNYIINDNQIKKEVPNLVKYSDFKKD